MSSCAENSVAEPSNKLTSTNDTDVIRLQVDDFDPYLDNLGDFNFEDFELEDEDKIEDGTEYEVGDIVLEESDEEANLIGIKPYIGLEFPTIDKAYGFYNRYAGHVGFSIRRTSYGTNKNGLSSYRFVCSKSGAPQSKPKIETSTRSFATQRTPERERGQTRIGCAASCRIKLGNDGLWRVSVFMEHHNHELITSPSKKRNLRSQKKMTMAEKRTINRMIAQNVGSSQIYEYIANEKGGKQFVRFKKKDVSNVVTATNKKYLGIDVDSTLMYFQKKQEEDPEFFYAVEPDGSGSVKSIFWVDGRARRAYQEFGDVVTFDTTYQTNKYSMPLAPFIGVSHHRFSIFFGMALIRQENTETFVWLFKTWLVAMYGKHPKTIITDQDRAMKKAIELVFHNTLHRCCQWHVMRKAREKLGPLLNDIKGFKEELNMVINRSLTIPDFEKGWLAMVDLFKLHNNEHLKTMFKSRAEWVPAYFRASFFADMSTTQRSESMNALLKLWTSNHKSIYQFVLLIEKMVNGIWQSESDEDFANINEIPNLWSHYQMELEARQVYTRHVFAVFKVIIKNSLLGFVNEIKKDVQYEVEIDSHPTIRNWVPESYLVEINKEEDLVSCNCKGFEFEGLLCSHAIKVMHHVKMKHLPDRYILKRWTKGANSSVKRPIKERSMEEGDSMELQTLRFAAIKSDLMKFAKLGTMNAISFRHLREIITSGTENFLKMVETEPEMELAETEPKTPLFLVPPDAQCKGKRKKITRFNPAIEKKPRKMRTCSICNAKKGHNARTCPKRKGLAKITESEGTQKSETDSDSVTDSDNAYSEDTEN